MADSSYRDRSVGLVFFGIIEILIGAFVALLIPLMIVAALISDPGTTKQTGLDATSMIAAALMYGVIAVAFVVVGFGSILARRWARAVMLSLSWLWLITGALTMAVFWFAVPRIVSSAGLPDIDPEVERLVLLTTSLFVGLIYVLLPLCFVLFYRSEHVAATCRARDPGPSWVDDRPQGLINLVVVYGLVAVTVLMMPAYDFFFPLFGLVLSGAPGAVAWAGVLVLFLWLVKSTMRTEEIAWRVSMVASVLGALSSIVTSVLVPYDRLLQSMGLPEAQRELVRSVWDPGPAAVAVVTGACWLTWIVYVVSVRRYFSNGPER